MVAPPSPRLIKNTALAIGQNVQARLSGILPDIIPSSGFVLYLPVVYYWPTSSSGGVSSPYIYSGATETAGTWTAPFTGSVQVECWGGGGGGGGGGIVSGNPQGGAGGGGGEYACEQTYPVVAGNTYPFTIDPGGTGGPSGSPGTNGGQTTFDAQGIGLPGGVVANGGMGGDAGSTIGTGGAGGTGSANSVHNNGGQGGSTGNGTTGYDYPLTPGNPNGFATSSQLTLWYPFDDPGPGTVNPNLVSVADLSGNNNVGGGSGIAQGVTTAPPQVSNATGSIDCTYFSGPSSSGVVESSTTFTFPGALTVAAWVNNISNGFAGQNMRICANDHPASTGAGFDLYVGGTSAGTPSSSNINAKGYVYFQMGNGGGTQRLIWSNSSLGPTGWNQWHYVVGLWTGATPPAGSGLTANTMYLYIDGVQQSQTQGSTTYHYSNTTTQPPTFGCNPEYNGDFFSGQMANGYVALVCATPTYISSAFGSSPATGGAGGGGSGGFISGGSIGIAGSGSTGGAGGKGGGYSGGSYELTTDFPANEGNTGGSGGNSGISGTVGTAVGPQPIPASLTAGNGGGAGGGGAGSVSSVPVTYTSSFLPAITGTYAGPDATGGQANDLINESPSNGTIWQGGTTSYNGALTGTQIGMLVLPSNIQSLLSSVTIKSVELQFQTIGGSGRTCLLGYTNNTSMPSTVPSPASVTALTSFKTGANNNTNYTYNLTSTGLGAALKAGTATALVFGNGTTGAYNSNSYNSYHMEIAGASNTNNNNGVAPELIITYTTSGGAVSGGNGAPGAICIAYTTPSTTPVASFLNEGSTDTAGNAFGAGFTGQIAAFQPGSTYGSQLSPTAAETWHSVPAVNLDSGWSYDGGLSGFFYRLLSSNDVEILLGLTLSSTGTSGSNNIYTMPAAYIPVTSQNLMCGWSNGGGAFTDPSFIPHLEITSAGVLILQTGSTTAHSNINVFGTYIYSLNVT
jgi:hypothetical protein